MLALGFLPVLSSYQDAASFELAVLPFFHAALHHISEYKHGIDLYTHTNPFVSGSAFSMFASAFVFVASMVTGNWSWVDRLWGIMPMIYGLHYLTFAHLNGLVAPRLVIMTAIQILWGIRLTLNYWRKGGFEKGSEDYRWVYVRKYSARHFPASLQPVILVFFNLFLVSIVQNIQLFLLNSPNYLVMLIGSYRPLGYEDLIVGTLLLICIGTETLADEQQWIYQNAKKASPSKSTRSHSREAHPTSYCQPEDLSRGFIAGGLWRYSRHPNFACEQAIWGLFYAWGCVATHTHLNWTASGALNLVFGIFMISTIITEWITSQKYPEYKVYQQKVPKFIPMPGYVWDDEEEDEKKVR